MGSYTISQEILDYDMFYKELYSILHNKNNKFCVTHHLPLGKSSCGFSIEHYSVGYGPIHIVYMAGAHGNEIIGVDFVLQLMKNLALGNGVFQDFEPSLFTIDFIPVQNPEGFFITTYALKSVMKTKTLQEQKIFCKNYYLHYRAENEKIKKVNTILENISSFTGSRLEQLISSFWQEEHEACFGWKEVVRFLEQKFYLKVDVEIVRKVWEESIKSETLKVSMESYLEPFQNLDLNCIPLRDDIHINLRTSLEKMYQNTTFPMYTLANFLANASGINLNDNNPYYFKILNEQKRINKEIYASPIYPILKSEQSPYGTCSLTPHTFSYATENEAILNFLEKLGSSCYAFFNIHGTGGLLYDKPYYSLENEREPMRNFSFYINQRIATEYLKEVEKTYMEINGIREFYSSARYPKEIRGFADMLRSRHIAHFLLELSLAGGNPIGPYIEPNYRLTMEANFRGCHVLMNTILELQDLYDKLYVIDYTREGNVAYETRKLQRKTDCGKE